MQFYLQMRETSDRTHHCSNQARFFIFEIKKKKMFKKELEQLYSLTLWMFWFFTNPKIC